MINAAGTVTISSHGTQRLVFIDGVCEDEGLLRHHILAPIKQALPAQLLWQDGDRDVPPTFGTLRMSLFPNVPGDVLLMFDLADRNHFRQFSSEGRPLVRSFRKVLVPGAWMARHILADRSLHLSASDIVVVGSTRIDYLRQLQSERPPRPEVGPLRVLLAPLHDNWNGRDGKPMSCRQGMEPYLDLLRSRVDLDIAVDSRNRPDKRPVTDALLAADVVITECTSLIYEAWALGKPVIFPHWLTAERLLEKAPHCAEAHIYRERIGHHPESIDALLDLLAQGPSLNVGPGVDAFMKDYLFNYGEGESAPVITALLERMADPGREAREREMRAEAEKALKEKDWPSAEKVLSELLVLNASDSSLYDQLAKAMNSQSKWWQEMAALESAVMLKSDDAGLQYRLGVASQRMGRHRAAAAAYSQAIRLAPKKATSDWYYRLGYMFETPGSDGAVSPRAAGQAYETAIAMDSSGKAKLFGIGALHAGAGRWREAAQAYRAKLSNQPFDAELYYRLGMAHDRCYEWAEAEAAYISALALDVSKAAWHYRLGFVQERQGKFLSAAEAYLHAAQLTKTPQPTWFYRAGYVLEKLGKLEDACAAYLAVQPDATLLKTPSDYEKVFQDERERLVDQRLKVTPQDTALWIEYSTILETHGNLQAAMEAAGQAMVRSAEPNPAYAKRHAALGADRRERQLLEARLSHDCTRKNDWARYSELLEAAGEIAEAAEAIEQAIWRSDDHMPQWHHRHGRLLMQLGRLPEACTAFRNQQILQRPHGIYEDKFEKETGVRFHATLREFHDMLPVQENTILYEVHLGTAMACNPLAIFENLLQRPGFETWRHFWVIDDLEKVPEKYRASKRVFFAKRGSPLYLRLITTCKVLVNNGTFAEWFVRRPEQLYLNTWHGTPLKTLGSDMSLPITARANTTRNFLQATHMIFPNEHTRRVQIEGHNVQHLATARQLISGYPRNDQLARVDAAARQAMIARLGLDPAKPVVLYAPTYRGSWNSPELEADAIIQELHALSSPDYSLVFRGHHLVERQLAQMDMPVTVAPQRIDTNQLLVAVDTLVSDYSSIIFDFMVLNRPVVQYVPDFEQYATERGLYLAKEDMPWRMCEDVETARTAIIESVQSPEIFLTDAYAHARTLYCRGDDGQAADRTIDFLFSADDGQAAARSRNHAAHGIAIRSTLGTINGIASSAVALVNNLSKADHPVVLMLDAVELKKGELGDEAIRRLESAATVLIRSGTQSLSLEEQWLWSKFNTDTLQGAPEMRERLLAGFGYENDRIFGQQSFRLVVDHQGYHPLWACILATTPALSRAIYLHNDMVSEAQSRLPNLSRVFMLYDKFDRLISVSPSSSAKNEEELLRIVPETRGRYRFVHNGLNRDEILEKAILDETIAEVDPDLEQLRQDKRYKLINLARLWPEKNQLRLIEAVRLLAGQGRDISLYILGEGPLRVTLEQIVRRIRLTDRILLPGVKRNPFPFLQAADCHVLSSDYEGQGIVLLEAMTLGVPCVATDIPGPQSVLANGLGRLTGLSAEALAEGIADIMDGRFMPRPFDADAYNAQALAEFLDAVGLKRS